MEKMHSKFNKTSATMKKKKKMCGGVEGTINPYYVESEN